AGTTFAEFKEVLDTGLFAARGEQMLGWAQQMFGEFLACDWSAAAKFNINDLWQLTTLGDAKNAQVIPQLITCAAWLSELHSDYAAKLLKHDPTVLLNADETALDMKTRKKLTNTLLASFDSGL